MIISETSDLIAFVNRIRSAGMVALDTEFVWTETFYPRLGIIQAALPGGEAVILDVLALKDLSSLAACIEDQAIIKILHDAQQDLTIIRRACGAYPKNVFDARLVAGFVGMRSTISLVDLTENILGKSMSKAQQRSDWLRRPLDKKQVEYALEDVRHMPELREGLLERLRNRGREQWAAEELRRYDDTRLYDEPDPRNQFLRVKGAGILQPKKLAILREIAAWREIEARAQNRPRNHIVTDRSLVTIAKSAPASPLELTACLDSAREAVRYGTALLQNVEIGRSLPREEWPASMQVSMGKGAPGHLVDTILDFVGETCRTKDLDVHLLALQSEVTALVHQGEKADPAAHRLLQGWRREFIGSTIVAMSVAGRG